jgi:hypothetical protein
VFSVNDWLDGLLLGAFFFGLVFSVAALLLGFADLSFGGTHVGHGDHGGHDGPSTLNFGVILAFITWFGGVAYLLRDGLDLFAPIALVLGLGAGFVGGYLVRRLFLYARSQETIMNPENYRLPGVIARVTSSIRENGTGEVMYEQMGVRQVSAARSDDGIAIPKGTEVVILRRDKGVVYVDLWENLVDRPDSSRDPGPKLAQPTEIKA